MPSFVKAYFCCGEFGCTGSLRSINPVSISGRRYAFVKYSRLAMPSVVRRYAGDFGSH